MKYMEHSVMRSWCHLATVLVLACFAPGCAELDQLMKPRVEGLQQAPGFNGAVLTQGGIGEVHVESNLRDEPLAINSLEAMLVASVRQKRRDILVSENGRYQVTATLLANDVSKRSDNFDSHIYRWTKRRVKVNYAVTETGRQEPLWSGIIETSREELSSYETDKDNNTGKAIDAVVAAINKKDMYPYPSPPIFSDIAKLNFEGFALNLPSAK